MRELENVIERSVALATRPVILLEDLPLDLAMHEPGQSRSVGEPLSLSLKEARERFEHGIRSLPHGALMITIAGEVAA